MNILIADDSLVSRSYIKKILSISKCSEADIYEAKNGKEALHFLESSEVFCLFLDINMPIMTGLELLNQLEHKKLLGKTEIVITSSIADAQCIEQLKSKGIHYFLRKPFTPEDMVKITNILMKGTA